jgi:hypothetical protein
LDRASAINRFCEQYGFKLAPSITDGGDFETPRVLGFQPNQAFTPDEAREELVSGESEQQEFKGSLLFDLRRAQKDPRATLSDLKSEQVLYSSLKTIAAFLNSGGGRLFLGVSDKGIPSGIECDYQVFSPGMQSYDGWQLTLRNHVHSRFLEGASVNDYLQMAPVLLDGKLIVRVEVASRKRLSFLREQNACALYRRQGNRTAEVHIEDIEEYLESRVH